MRYATLCSGIEGFGLGFDRAGHECVFQCEANKDALTVLRKHYQDVPKTEDVNDERTTAELVRLRPGLVAFGSPCQDLSVAGQRKGLAGQRSGLFFRCVELCFACEAPLVCWENVPGVFSSNKGRDFAAVLEAFTGFHPSVPPSGWRNTGVCIGPLYSVAWAVLDSQWFGVAQQRRRVFIVGSLGKRSRPYEILSLADCLPWNPPPSRETGARVAPCVRGGIESGSNEHGNKVAYCADDYQAGTYEQAETSRPLTTSADRSRAAPIVAHALTAGGHDASEDGTGRGTPLVVNCLDAHMGMGGVDDNAAQANHIVATHTHRIYASH